MVNGIGTNNPRGFNKGRSSKFRVGSRVRETHEEGRGLIGRNVVEILYEIIKTTCTYTPAKSVGSVEYINCISVEG